MGILGNDDFFFNYFDTLTNIKRRVDVAFDKG